MRATAVRNMLGNVASFFSQFEGAVEIKFESVKKPILKELREYVKIATWKDVNIFALTESAKRTHHHLNKFIKKYRLGLLLPVKTVIASFHENIPALPKSVANLQIVLDKFHACKLSFVSNLPAIAESAQIFILPTRLSQTVKLYSKSRIFAQELIEDSRQIDAVSNLDELFHQIVSRVKDFQSEQLGINERVVKGQKMIRKKAWVDLLKHLALIGLGTRSTQKYSLHQDIVYMNSQGLLELEDHDQIFNGVPDIGRLITRSNIYHFRAIARLEIVRKMVVLHSLDITSLELEKSISFLDHLMHLSLERRAYLNSSSISYTHLNALIQQIKEFVELGPSNSVVSRVKFSKCQAAVTAVYISVEQTVLVLKANLSSAQDFLSLKSLFFDFQSQLASQKRLIDAISMSINPSAECEVLRIPSVGIAVESSFRLLNSFVTSLDKCEKDGKFSFIWKDFHSVLNECLAELHNAENIIFVSTDDCTNLAEQCLDKALVLIQVMHKKEDSSVDQELDFRLLLDAHETAVAPFASCAMKDLSNALGFLFNSVATSTDIDLTRVLMERLYPILDQALLLFKYRLFELVLFHKSCLKFSYILSNTFYAVIKNGFCAPNANEDDDDDGGLEDDVAGMGIGEGDGKKDVSDEIENEDQVEGLQDEIEKAPEPQKQVADEENGIEMENDFDGALDDVEPQDESGDDDTGEDKEPEEQMGAVDDLADVVDEKMWGEDDPGNADGGENDKTEKDAPVDNAGGDIETVAQQEDQKDTESDQKKEKQPEGKPDPVQEIEEQIPEPGDDEDGKVNEDTPDMYEDSHGVDVKPADDMHDEDDEMDLPDDMQIDGEQDDDTKSILPEDDAMDQDDHDAAMPNEADGNIDPDSVEDEPIGEEVNEMPDNEIGDEKDLKMPEADEIDDDEAETAPANGFDENQIPEPVQDDAEGDAKELEDDVKAIKDHNQASIDESSQPFGVEGAEGDQSVQDSENFNQGASSAADDKLDSKKEEMADGRESQTQNSVPENDSSSKAQQSSAEPNPHRSVGNAAERWMDRLRNIVDSLKESNAQKEEKEGEGDEFEFVKDDDEDQGDTQALGVADKEQLEKMDKQALNEEKEDENSSKLNDDEMDIEEPIGNPPMMEERIVESKDMQVATGKGGTMKTKEEEEDNLTKNQNEENQEEQMETQELDMKCEVKESIQHLKEFNEEEPSLTEPVEVMDEVIDYESLRLELEQRMSLWRSRGHQIGESQELWRKYSNLTRDLSFHLCEQLRLILEPTLSTKLKGDYRTGKRLNMRKIIPYIASQFKKDKIWLRRTKPSKRTYQIMVAIDDSLSMANSHSVQLAFESLTLITNALNQLEVGEIGVMSFGQAVQLIHPFESAWSDEAGSTVLSAFSFSQDGTRVRLLMEQSLEILSHSRALRQASDLWQLEIIISDGICEDHEFIKTRVRSAAEDHIAMVFVILDTRSEKDSIINMSNVSYDTDPITMTPTLKMTKYMDTFPFDFYVVVREVERLPEILADTLRQFFQFVAQ